MAPSLPSSLLSFTTVLLILQPTAVHANAIASWWVETDSNNTPQIFQYNATTNTIYASLCNSIGDAPIFTRNASTALQTTITPLANTGIASVGYLSDSSSSDSTLETTVFYLADDAGTTTIAAAPYTCNATSGYWTASAPAAYISNGTTSCGTAPAVDAAGGLAAMYLNEADGMRVLFKQATTLQTHYLQYLPSGEDGTGNCTGWSYAGAASPLPTGPELGVSFLPSTPKVWSLAQTVLASASVAAADTSAGGDIEFSTSNAGGVADLWSINRLPTLIIADNGSTTQGVLSNMATDVWDFVATTSWGFEFEAFSGSVTRLGVATDGSGVPSVFYLGTDGGLRRFDADVLGHWHAATSRDDSKWPVADIITADAGGGYADFGLAYDTAGNRIWMFYEVNGQMTQVYQSVTSVWQDSQTLATYNASLATTSSSAGHSSGSGSSVSETSGEASTNNSSVVKVGLGVGLGLGIPLACGAILLVYLLRQRRRRVASGFSPSENNGGKSPVSPMTEDSVSPAAPDQNQGYWQNGVWIEKTVTEYYADGAGPGARYNRPGQLLGELDVAGNRGPIYYELPPVGERRVELH